ncbi:amino acid ABC transporter substrate-binding protein (PAAT family) [Roseibium hamelinense]|uniref:Amino acid ABC transporter substrate-binding protein (PAAT family) n=1 Tax=Roseibium hamelinense TaxID=150831 RepID=A0A562TAD7_9HYPH|nr:amino acid ABC transporter substrate-binding protein (PAAT family) [Roseibium hamelinense]
MRWLAGLSSRAILLYCTAFLSAAVLGAAPGSAQEFRLITSPWPPSNYLDEEGRPTGLSVAVVEAIKHRLGVDTPIEVLPWARGYVIAEQNPNVMLFTAGRTDERVAAGFEFIGPIVMWRHVLLSRSDATFEISDLEDVWMQDLTAAAVRGSWQAKLLQSAGVDVVETDDQAMSARMLLAGRIDLWFTSSLQASVVLRDLNEPQNAVVEHFTIRKSPSYLMISKGTDPALLAEWRGAFQALKSTGFYDELVELWSARLGIPLGHDPDQGTFAKPQNISFVIP